MNLLAFFFSFWEVWLWVLIQQSVCHTMMIIFPLFFLVLLFHHLFPWLASSLHGLWIPKTINYTLALVDREREKRKGRERDGERKYNITKHCKQWRDREHIWSALRSIVSQLQKLKHTVQSYQGSLMALVVGFNQLFPPFSLWN